MHKPTVSLRLGAALLLGILAVACQGDPYQSALKERARWSVDVLGVTLDEAGTNAKLSLRVGGPPNASIEQLTVRFSFQDEAGAELGDAIHTFDLTSIPRGTPQDMVLSFDVPAGFAGVGVDPMAAPTEAQRAKIPELAGL